MSNTFLNKLRKAPWVLLQPLTKKPKSLDLVVSDLFIWRCNQDWKTYFECLDIPRLFGDNEKHNVDIVFFDNLGQKFYEKTIFLDGLKRQRIDISQLLSSFERLPSDYGSFSVFHKKIPRKVKELNSYIAERGYSSYQYKNAPLRSYVHGNLDAIDSELNILSSRSFFQRSYNLQFLLEPKKSYEMGIINVSRKLNKFEFIVESFDNGRRYYETIKLRPLEIFFFSIKDLKNDSFLVIKSKMIMARPVIFSFDADKLDVLHG